MIAEWICPRRSPGSWTRPGPGRALTGPAEPGGRSWPMACRSGGALTLAVPHPTVARRTWLWRAETGAVIEALGFAAVRSITPDATGWRGSGPYRRRGIGPGPDGRRWAGRVPALRPRRGGPAAPGRALRRGALSRDGCTGGTDDSARTYLGRRSAAPVQAGAFAAAPGRRSAPRCCMPICGRLHRLVRGGGARGDDPCPRRLVDRLAGAVHAFGGEVLKFIGDGLLRSSSHGAPAEPARRRAARCGEPLPAPAWPISIRRAGADLSTAALRRGAAPRRDPVGQYRRGRTGPGLHLPSALLVNLQRAAGRPAPAQLGSSVLISGALAAETTTPWCRWASMGRAAFPALRELLLLPGRRGTGHWPTLPRPGSHIALVGLAQAATSDWSMPGSEGLVRRRFNNLSVSPETLRRLGGAAESRLRDPNRGGARCIGPGERPVADERPPARGVICPREGRPACSRHAAAEVRPPERLPAARPGRSRATP